QYVKTFSPRWQPAQIDPKTKKPGPGFKQGNVVRPCVYGTDGKCDTGKTFVDPWMDASREMEGIERGKYLFHAKAQCGSCHPNYVTRQELSDMNVKANGAPLSEFRDDMYGSVLKESQYKVGAGAD